MKAPEVEGYISGGGEDGIEILGKNLTGGRMLGDFFMFGDGDEVLVFINQTNTAGNGAVEGKRRFEVVGNEGGFLRTAGSEEGPQLLERRRAIVVIGIHHGKGAIDNVIGRKNSVGCPPRFFAFGRKGHVGGEKGPKLLVNAGSFKGRGQAGDNFLGKEFLIGGLDDEVEVRKSSQTGIVEGVFEKGFTTGANGVELF